ncbi:uncharacterized protein [Nerophis lumbriciformis]|uniref:uncharacterized protein isoform X3 n=1 Tax=Nerophis lumbriciformis TaxID=546530 RepID=UPI003BA86DC5
MCERTKAKYEEELCPTKEEKDRQHQLLDALFQKHQHTTEFQQALHLKEEEEEPHSPHIKEEEEEVWISQEEADLSKFPLTLVSVKTEDKAPESSQLHHSPGKEKIQASSR